MELKELTLADIEMVKQLFLSVFSQEPWNDDWSDEEQLDRYLGDLLSHPRALCFGLLDQGSLIALSLGHIRYWYEGPNTVLKSSVLLATTKDEELVRTF